MFSSLVLIGSLVASAAAHGFVSEVIIAGKSFPGNNPGANGRDSIIRQVSSNEPVKGANNPDVNCGLNAQRAALVADALPGDEIAFDWPAGGGQPWPHSTGPMFTYLASCGDQSCDEFDSADAQWFKIQQVGKKSNGKWAQSDLMNGATAKITLPSNLAAGNYLIRHEILALHIATSRGGAEFYPSCAQIRVGGNQNGAPKQNELVTFPGGYSDDDAGIFVPNVFDQGLDYEFPGPKIASFVTGSSNGSGDDEDDEDGTSSSSATSTSKTNRPTSSSSSSSSSSPSSTSSSASQPTGANNSSSSSSSSTKGSCSLKKREVNLAKRKAQQYKPRHISRIMRDLFTRDSFSSTH